MRLLSLLLILSLPSTALASPCSDLKIEKAWGVPTMPKDATISAGYLTLFNPGSEPCMLQSVSLAEKSEPLLKAIEIHTHSMKDGVMQMRPLKELEIPAGERVAFAPGGLHLMLIGLTRPLTDGESLPLTLQFAQGAKIDTLLQIGKLKPVYEPGYQPK